MSELEWRHDDIPVDRPNPARMYDYFLGGYHNFDIDRTAAQKVIEVYPDMPQIMRANRAFLRRAVRFVGEQGILQFLDIGSGIPTVGNVHEIAQRTNPAARIVYVDLEPVAVRQSTMILKDNPQTAAIQADLRQVDQILHHPDVRRLLDFSQPVAVLLVSMLLFIADDEEAYRAVHTLRDAVAPGSHIAISHGTYDGLPKDKVQQALSLYKRTTNAVSLRSRAQIEKFFDGLELVEPGLVRIPLWRPETPDELFLDRPEESGNFAGVGRKP